MNRIFNNKNKCLSLLLLFVLLILLLIRPYEFVIFDSEPDYLANALHISQWNIPWGGHHPGTLAQYMYASLIILFQYFKLNLDVSIYILRTISFLVSIGIIYFSKKFIVSDKNKFITYAFVFLLLFPLVNFHISHLGIELFIFSISLLICVQIYNCLITNNRNKLILIIPCLIGLAASLKFSTITLYIFYLSVLFFFIEYSFKKKITIFIYSLFSLGLTFLFLTIPSIKYYPKLFNKVMRQLNFDLLLINNLYIMTIFIIVFSLIFFLIFFFYNKKIVDYSNKKKTIFYYIFFLFILIIFLTTIFKNISYTNFLETYFTLPILLRNLNPLLPVFMILLFNMTKKINTKLFIFLIILNLTTNVLYFYNTKSQADIFIEDNRQKNIVMFDDSVFNSKYFFREYTNQRWGNGILIIPDNWKETKEIRIILKDLFEVWINNKKLENNEKLKNNEEIKKRIDFRKYFLKVPYVKDNRFKIFSLSTPPHQSRVYINYCDYFNSDNLIIFDTHTDNQLKVFEFFKKNIPNIEIKCGTKLYKKTKQNGIVYFSFN